MKLIKRAGQGLLIFLIIVSLGAIIYVLQWKEEPARVKKTARPDEKQSAVPLKSDREKPDARAQGTARPPGGREKEKITTAKIEKFPVPGRRIAIIIDDIGNDLKPVKELLKTNAQITFAILPFLDQTQKAAEMLHKADREILLHLPMEPTSYPLEKPGAGALFIDMNEKELLHQLDKNLSSVPHISGVNNHMGSKFMTAEGKLEVVFKRLKKNNLFFIDSRTTKNSKASIAARKTGVPMASRSIFLDNIRDYSKIYGILAQVAEESSPNQGSPVIIIGHPYPETIRAIKDAVGLFQTKGVEIVPVSRLIKDQESRGAS